MTIEQLSLNVDPVKPAEEWLGIPGYEGIYEASSYGRIRSWLRWRGIEPPRLLSPTVAANRYEVVNLGKRWGLVYVHRLVALAFIGPCPDGMLVTHWDDVRTNNVPSNLRYGTYRHNAADRIRNGHQPHGEKHYAATLTKQQVVEIIDLLNDGVSYLEISRLYGVHKACVHSIMKRKNWKRVFEEQEAAVLAEL